VSPEDLEEDPPWAMIVPLKARETMRQERMEIKDFRDLLGVFGISVCAPYLL
jgi:hypothetical protein